MKLSEMLKLDQEGREREYMRVLGLEEVDPIGILSCILDEMQADPTGEILLSFARSLKEACVPEGNRSELDVEEGSE